MKPSVLVSSAWLFVFTSCMKSYKSIDMVEKDDSSDTKTLVTPEEILMIGSFRGGTSCGPERIKFTRA